MTEEASSGQAVRRLKVQPPRTFIGKERPQSLQWLAADVTAGRGRVLEKGQRKCTMIKPTQLVKIVHVFLLLKSFNQQNHLKPALRVQHYFVKSLDPTCLKSTSHLEDNAKRKYNSETLNSQHQLFALLEILKRERGVLACSHLRGLTLRER